MPASEEKGLIGETQVHLNLRKIILAGNLVLASVEFWKGDKILLTFQPDLTKFGVSSSFPPVKKQLMHILTFVVVGRKHIWLETSAEMKVGVFSRQDGPVGYHITVEIA